MKELNEYIKELNRIISKIKNPKNLEQTLDIILPLLYFMKDNDILNENEFNILIRNKRLKIKKLKYYRFDDFYKVSDEIEEYLSTFIDESLTLLPPDMDYQSVYFILYEILINVYKHSNLMTLICKL